MGTYKGGACGVGGNRGFGIGTYKGGGLWGGRVSGCGERVLACSGRSAHDSH